MGRRSATTNASDRAAKAMNSMSYSALTTPEASSRRGTRRSGASTETRGQSPAPRSSQTKAASEQSLSRSSRRVIQAVNIPIVSKRARSTLVQETASSTTSDASLLDNTDDVETPATSLAPTPAEPVRSYSKSTSLRGRGSKTDVTVRATTSLLERLPSAKGAAGGKRKRSSLSDALEATSDEQMAQMLQEQEYAQLLSADASTTGRMDDEEDLQEETDDLSECSNAATLSDYEEESDVDEAARKITKRARTTAAPTTSARGRAARAALVSLPQDASYESEEAIETSASASYVSEEDYDDEEMENEGGTAQTPQAGARPSRIAAFRARRGRGRATRAEYERHRLETMHPEITTLWDDLKAIPTITPERDPQPPGISRDLKSFQLEGLNWMRRQEQSKWKGGLLGDEMGMGKTIQAVSLIMSDYPAKHPTLVVVPPVALMQWSTEIKAYTDGKLKILIHHNTDPKVKKLSVKDLKQYDVIMISYSGLESIFRKESKGWKRDNGLVKENSRIHALHYHRLILDEAHSIKSRTASVAKACFALKSDYKWCLSGTPVQNRIGEFFSLLRFLEVAPFASYFCKSCACAELHWSQDERKRCTHCGHSGFSHVSIFNQELLIPITQASDPQERKAALGKLRLLTDRIMLRRIKRDHTASMELPPKDVIIHNEFFGEIERDFSSSIMTNTHRTFDTYVSRGVMLNNYANIFGLIMQMRQVANHPDLILRKHAQSGQNVLVCCICDETAEEPIRSRCHHEFCRRCAKDYVLNSMVDPDCPRCHVPLAIDFEQPDIEQDEDHVKKNSIINRIKMEDWTSSTKIEMLIYDLYKLRSKKQTHKSIVFSQFTSMLQLVEWRLRRAGFNTVMLDGSMSPVQRDRSIQYFMNNVNVEVFLVSLKAGGVALNLTEASRVFIIDPWWNPAAEWQSADRCHRIGQRRPCVITRLCIEDSVESRIVLLQEKKAHLISSTINHDEVAMEKLTPEDMQFLFRGS